jgi:hypothetical protein
MLVMRKVRVWSGRACRRCAGKVFARTTLHNLTLGWWGTISLFVTPLFLISNLYYWTRTWSLPAAAVANRARLDENREYAMNLLATKDEATVIDVLARETGVDAGEVRAYVRALPPREAISRL